MSENKTPRDDFHGVMDLTANVRSLTLDHQPGTQLQSLMTCLSVQTCIMYPDAARPIYFLSDREDS